MGSHGDHGDQILEVFEDPEPAADPPTEELVVLPEARKRKHRLDVEGAPGVFEDDEPEMFEEPVTAVFEDGEPQQG